VRVQNCIRETTYDTNRKWRHGKCEQEQKEHISREIKNKQLQSNTFVKFITGNSKLVAANLEVTKVIAQDGKQFGYGDCIVWVQCAPFSFEDFPEKKNLSTHKELLCK
jgi:hypothetical protein